MIESGQSGRRGRNARQVEGHGYSSPERQAGDKSNALDDQTPTLATISPISIRTALVDEHELNFRPGDVYYHPESGR